MSRVSGACVGQAVSGGGGVSDASMRIVVFLDHDHAGRLPLFDSDRHLIHSPAPHSKACRFALNMCVIA